MESNDAWETGNGVSPRVTRAALWGGFSVPQYRAGTQAEPPCGEARELQVQGSRARRICRVGSCTEEIFFTWVIRSVTKLPEARKEPPQSCIRPSPLAEAILQLIRVQGFFPLASMWSLVLHWAASAKASPTLTRSRSCLTKLKSNTWEGLT